MSIINELHGDKSKINVCEQPPGYPTMTNVLFEFHSTMLESILSTRLPDETFRGLLNFLKVYAVQANQNERQKALVSDYYFTTTLNENVEFDISTEHSLSILCRNAELHSV